MFKILKNAEAKLYDLGGNLYKYIPETVTNGAKSPRTKLLKKSNYKLAYNNADKITEIKNSL